ncbi:tyrosine-protein phosphatase non-receptor type 9-like [Cydia pomonella]|uniref:tyrosine-protein phosphatase non-receptor type 9-like n=1 Tax=Cydia pomonella TaxID=82600 RepID=UPI002ADDF61A|nr:tyrosine-protein phosphatase non-receptor type 9-like [Cydia pomonella]
MPNRCVFISSPKIGTTSPQPSIFNIYFEMGNSCFKTLSAAELLEMTSHPNFCKLIRREHSQVMSVPLRGTIACFSREENLKKNRYSGIPCWDHSRVIISSRENLVFDDNWKMPLITEETASYIHANFVDGFKTINKYICTQTPMENTWETFFKLIWEQQSYVIVSLTDIDQDNLKNYQLWVNPEGSKVTFGKYVVRILEIQEKISYTRTRMQITNIITRTSREITNFWFTDWPDSSIPTGLKEFLNLRKEVNREQSRLIEEAEKSFQLPGPIVVHCSTGAGWTGTFCAVDNALAQLDKEKKVSLAQTILKIRSQRHTSVFLPEQYAFCYKVLEYVLLAEGKKLKNY